MSAHKVYVMINYDGEPYAVAHTEAERDRLLSMDDGTGEPDNSWRGAWCYEHHVGLAALPPSVIVDGRVVELEKVWTEMGLRHEGGYPESWELLAAARQVADRG